MSNLIHCQDKLDFFLFFVRTNGHPSEYGAAYRCTPRCI